MFDLVPTETNQLDPFRGFTPLEIRAKIVELEKAIMALPDSFDGKEFPLRHSFAEGIYVREIFIPAGCIATGSIHRHEHHGFLLSGEVLVISETYGWDRIKAPQMLITKAGTKRAVYAIADTWWATVHYVGAERNIETILDELTVTDYAQLEA